MNDRDCENCKHHKEVCKNGIFYHSCESWDCEFEQKKKRKPKEYVWLWVKVPYANEWNNYPEKEIRRYRVKEFKKKCIVLFNGKQYPYDQIVKRESEG